MNLTNTCQPIRNEYSDRPWHIYLYLIILRGRWMLETDWLTNVLRCAIIFRETHREHSSRQLSWPHILPNDFSYFKGALKYIIWSMSWDVATEVGYKRNNSLRAIDLLENNAHPRCNGHSASRLFLIIQRPVVNYLLHIYIYIYIYNY